MCFYVLKAYFIDAVQGTFISLWQSIERHCFSSVACVLEVLWLSETTKRFNLGAFNLRNQRLRQPHIPCGKNV